MLAFTDRVRTLYSNIPKLAGISPSIFPFSVPALKGPLKDKLMLSVKKVLRTGSSLLVSGIPKF